MQLDSKRSSIVSKISDILSAQIGSENGHKLYDVTKGINYGDHVLIEKLASTGDSLIWIIPEPYTPTSDRDLEDHDIPFTFAAMVNDLDPEAGQKKAESIRDRVYELLSSDRQLAGLVDVVMPGTIDPAYRVTDQMAVYSAACTLIFRVLLQE